VALAFAGLLLIVAPWQLTDLTGSVLAVSGGAVWAISAVLSKKWPAASADPLLFTAWQLLFGLAALVVLALVFARGQPVNWTFEFWWALAFSSIGATAMGWWLWTYVLSHTPAGITSLNALGIPVIAVIGSAIHLGERPPPMELAGMAMIGLAIALLAWLGLSKTSAAAATPVD
jgi:drug/metabolite transporter (DMT)-like permease